MTRQDIAWQDEQTARWYLDSLRGAIPFAAEHLTIMLRMVANGRRPVRRFLDVGAGDGALTAVMLARYPDAKAVLVDFSAPMLAAARERLASVATAPVVIEADLATRDWRDTVTDHAPFEAIVSGFAIHHLEDARKRELYGELCDLLAPGGAFVNIEHVAAEAPWMAAAFDEAMVDAIWERGRRTGPALTREAAATAYANRQDRDANRLTPLDMQCAWLSEVGFAGVVAPFRWYELAVFGGARPA